MNSGNKDSGSIINTQSIEPTSEFSDAFIAVGYASQTLRSLYLLLKNAGYLNRDCLCFPAAWPCENGAVSFRFIRLPLTFVLTKFFSRLDVCRRAHSNLPFRYDKASAM